LPAPLARHFNLAWVRARILRPILLEALLAHELLRRAIVVAAIDARLRNVRLLALTAVAAIATIASITAVGVCRLAFGVRILTVVLVVRIGKGRSRHRACQEQREKELAHVSAFQVVDDDLRLFRCPGA
jgi:hypothetical protein